MVILLSIEILLILSFMVLDLFFFCLFFESIIIPMFFLILGWGSQDRRVHALTYFVMYTIIGSIFLLLALFILYFEVQTSNYFVLFNADFSAAFTANKQCIVWSLLFITFAIKIPVFPFHI
jgi:NADH:ubiquinone oxidoreductase subunit 4 (subunit M)